VLALSVVTARVLVVVSGSFPSQTDMGQSLTINAILLFTRDLQFPMLWAGCLRQI